MYILGISGALGHDSAACLLKEGNLVAMAEEERFTRKTHTGEVPLLSIEFCLKKEGISLDEVDYIALSWDQNLYPDKKLLLRNYEDIFEIFPRKLFPCKRFPKVEIVDHHLAHAASSFYFSSFEEASVLVVDGTGEDCGTTLYHGKDNRLIKLDSIHNSQSLGEFYNAATRFLGFDIMDAGKTMGLASFGQPIYEFSKINLDDKLGYQMDIDPNVYFFNLDNVWVKEFIKMGIKPNVQQRKWNSILFKYVTELEFTEEHKNFASSVQRTLEESYLNLARVLVERTGSRNICLSGGVALNCVANGKLEKSGIADEVFIQPAASDAGTAIGAAAEVSARLGYRIGKLQHSYAGASFSNDEIITVLDRIGINYVVSNNVSSQTADFLAEGKTVGWFQGEAEFGPRALGNRSILSNPSIPGIRDYVNNIVKLREPFRPFGASVLEESAGEWFENISSSPFMLKSYQVYKDKVDQINGVVHVDGSCRPQTVNKTVNERYHSLISDFQGRTGVPMVLNTSFNLRGEPIVNTPYDAIRTYFTSALDILVLNEIMIVKK